MVTIKEDFYAAINQVLSSVESGLSALQVEDRRASMARLSDRLESTYGQQIADRHQKGAYYTQSAEVNLMCRESLRAYLEEKCPRIRPEIIAQVVYGEVSRNDFKSALPAPQALALLIALYDVTICDPATGAGTFPVAMFRRLFSSLRLLGQFLDDDPPFRDLIEQGTLVDWRKGYDLKLHIIEQCLYGCDMDPLAVQIAQLRLWMELIAECEQPVPISTIGFKLLAGNAFQEGIFPTTPPGFDIVIANPPYIRQEQIDDSFRAFGLAIRKRTLQEYFRRACSLHISGQADLYVYFYVRGWMLLKPNGGVHCFITPNSWLDAAYGVNLQEFLLAHTQFRSILENRSKRSFQDADVNTIITTLVTGSSSRAKRTRPVSFITLKNPFETYSSLELLEIMNAARQQERFHDPSARIKQVSPQDLFKNGYDDREKRYTGSKWGGIYLRAPDIYFQVTEAAWETLVPLKNLASVRRGITSGANEFFFLHPQGPSSSGLMNCLTETGEEFLIEEQFLKPAVKNTREVQTFRVETKPSTLRLFVCHQEKKDLRGSHALHYIEWGESRGFHHRPTCSPRARWWDAGERSPWPIWWIIAHNDRDPAFLNSGLIPSDNFFELRPLDSQSTPILFASLISSWVCLQRELVGRTGFGGGLLKTQGPDAGLLLVPNPALVSRGAMDRISMLVSKISAMPTLRIQDLWQVKERRELDQEIAGLILNRAAAGDIYQAAVELVSERLRKAKSA